MSAEQVPDESAQWPLEQFKNPRAADWPDADFVMGNPPFIGASNVRRALGDGYAEALRAAWPQVPESADFVMHWWDRAAQLVRDGKLRRFGFITTNSIRQTFNRRVLERHLTPNNVIPAQAGIQAERAARRAVALDTQEKLDSRLRGNDESVLRIVFAIPDHPWTDASDGAAVRIAMTAGTASAQTTGRLFSVSEEHEREESEGIAVTLALRTGAIHADLGIGANVAAAKSLRANEELSSRGVMLFGAGFIVTPEEAARLTVHDRHTGERRYPDSPPELDSGLRRNDGVGVIRARTATVATSPTGRAACT